VNARSHWNWSMIVIDDGLIGCFVERES